MNPKLYRYYTYIHPIINNKKVKAYSSLVFSLVTISIFAYFAIRPTVGTIISLQKSITDQEAVLTQLKTKSENILLGKTNYDNIDIAKKQKLETLLPTKSNIKSLIDNLSSITGREATISGLQFETFSLEPLVPISTQKPNLEQISFNFNLQGSYPQLLTALDLINNSNRLISIDSVTISKSADQGVLMSVSAKTYYLKN